AGLLRRGRSGPRPDPAADPAAAARADGGRGVTRGRAVSTRAGSRAGRTALPSRPDGSGEPSYRTTLFAREYISFGMSICRVARPLYLGVELWEGRHVPGLCGGAATRSS